MNEPPPDPAERIDSPFDGNAAPYLITESPPEGVGVQYLPHEADAALQRLGMTVGEIEDAVRAGDRALRQAPPFLPPWHRRGKPSAYTVASLSEAKVAQGWQHFVFGQNTYLLSPDGTLGILVWPGGEGTGDSKKRAKNARSRGDDTRDLFLRAPSPQPPLPNINMGAPRRPFDPAEDDEDIEDVEEADIEDVSGGEITPLPERWIVVLRRRTRGSRRVRCEVQLVERDALSTDGYLSYCLARFLLDPVDLDKSPLVEAMAPTPAPNPEVEVARREDPPENKS